MAHLASSGLNVARWLAITLCAWIAQAVLSTASAHNLSYALADVTLPASHDDASEIEITIRCHIPAFIMGAPQGHLSDTELPRFLALSDSQLNQREAVAEQRFLSGFSLRADGRLVDAVTLRFPDAPTLRADTTVPRASPQPSAPIRLVAQLPAGATRVDLALPPELGPAVAVIRYPDGQTRSEGLPDGERTRLIRLSGPDDLLDGIETLWRFIALGFTHILPLGLDHIAFIVALALGAPRFWTLAKLASVFTLAHSITLGLAAFRIVQVQPAIIEPAIAVSIVVVALMTAIRPGGASLEKSLIVFLFGLLHGLGFASALRETGLPRGQEAIGLAGFNLGVEFGQLAVIAVVLLVVAAVPQRASYRRWVAAPASLAIAALGTLWTIERIASALPVTGAVPTFGG